jgi:hypothetical protein
MARFTAANARENAAKSHAARQQRRPNGDLAGETFRQTPQVGPHEAAGDYVSRRLARVRAQLDLVDSAIEKAIGGDSKRLKELTEAQSRLEEQERRLSGRPLPGSRKPAPERVRPVIERPVFRVPAGPRSANPEPKPTG